MVAASTGTSDLVAVSHSSGVMFDFSFTGKWIEERWWLFNMCMCWRSCTPAE